MVDMWSTSNGGSVLLGTEGAMWEGLNLQHACSNLVFYEHDWTWAGNHQMIGRLQRDGQTRRVNVFFLITKGTIDWTVWKSHTDRMEMNDQLMAQFIQKGGEREGEA